MKLHNKLTQYCSIITKNSLVNYTYFGKHCNDELAMQRISDVLKYSPYVTSERCMWSTIHSLDGAYPVYFKQAEKLTMEGLKKGYIEITLSGILSKLIYHTLFFICEAFKEQYLRDLKKEI